MKKLKYIPKYDINQILLGKKAHLRPKFSIYTIIATVFYIGFLPISGTIASLATFAVYYFTLKHSITIAEVQVNMWIMFIITTIIGWICVSKYQQDTDTHDHSSIVIDEVIGMLLIFAISFPHCYDLAAKIYRYTSIKPTYMGFIIAFVTFRYFDIRKPFFIKYIDKSMNNSLSVILDDIAAALFACVTIWIAHFLVGKIL